MDVVHLKTNRLVPPHVRATLDAMVPISLKDKGAELQWYWPPNRFLLLSLVQFGLGRSPLLYSDDQFSKPLKTAPDINAFPQLLKVTRIVSGESMRLSQASYSRIPKVCTPRTSA